MFPSSYDIELGHAHSSHRYWIAIARETRAEMPWDRYAHARALRTAAYWRGEVRRLLLLRTAMEREWMTRKIV